jgi:hypothetical protein
VLLSWLKEHHGLELRLAQGVIAMAHNPAEYRAREKIRKAARAGFALPFALVGFGAVG